MSVTTSKELIHIYETETKGYWFSEQSMRFFNCRIEEPVYQVGHEFIFVSSEQGDDYPRGWTVRHWNGISKSIDSVGEFQQYDNREDALEAARLFHCQRVLEVK